MYKYKASQKLMNNTNVDLFEGCPRWQVLSHVNRNVNEYEIQQFRSMDYDK